METEPLFPDVPDELSSVDSAELSEIAAQLAAGLAEAAKNAAAYVTDEFTADDLLTEARGALAALEAIKAELASREEPEAEPEAEPAPEVEAEASADVDAELAALAEAAASDDDDDEDGNDDGEGETDGAPAGEKVMPNVKGKVAAKKKAAKAAITAAAARPALPRPTTHAPRETARQDLVPFTAGAAVTNIKPLGTPYKDLLEVAYVIKERARDYGSVPQGFSENEVVARADWRDTYPEDRHIASDFSEDMAMVAAVTAPNIIKAEFNRRKTQAIEQPNSLVASGGLCNPVTPYYNLQMISTPQRPVQAALPSFNADRGGIIFVQPPAISAFAGAVGLVTEAEDAMGGTFAAKSCLTVTCPSTVQTDVDIIYHCLTFGNLGARSFPEQVAQAAETTLAQHARIAEANLLTQIDTNSTVVTAGSLGLGASASLFSQVLAAANGIRSANRMDPDAVLRLLLPFWSVDLIVSDVIRTQFERFDTDEDKVTALWRSFDIEPTYYLDSASGRGQVFATQGAGVLNTFPSSVWMYLFPEGSHLFLDGGVLELGIVRDSVLNAENQFQLFGESFENAAYVGIQSLAINASTCDNGKVSAPYATDACPYSYADAT